MATKIDDLYADISIRGMSGAMGSISRFQGAIQSLKGSMAGGLAFKFAASNIGELRSLIGAGGISALIGAGTVKAAADLEKARLGLKRFVDTDFDNLAAGIDKMSYKIPIAVSGLYDIASGAAQVGIEGTKNILAFTEVVGKLATVSNMSFNETAKDLAKLHNVFGLSASESPRTANVIAGLSAASAADPAELITTTRYLSGASSTIKFTLDQTIALAAAIKDAGISSEVGGTAFNKLILDMAKMPEAFAEITNMTSGDFKKLRDSNPMQALLKALKSVASESSIEDKIAKSDKIGVESVRQSGALLQLIKALEIFEEHLQRATKFGDEKTVLDKQFNTQAESTYAKLQKLGNAFMQVADQLGGGLSRAVGTVADALTSAALSLKEPGKVNLGVGGGAPAGQAPNIGVAPPGGAPGQFRPQNMGVPGNAKPVIPAQAKPDPNAPKTPDQLAKEFREGQERLDAANKKVADAREQEAAATSKEKKSFDEMERMKERVIKAREDTHVSEVERDRTAARIDKKADAARTKWVDSYSEQVKARDDLNKALEEQKAAIAKHPFGAPVIPAAGNQADKPLGELVKQGALKFAFDKIVDPQSFKLFQSAFRSLPKEMLETGAGKALAAKLAAIDKVDVKQNMTEDQLRQIAEKRAGAIGAVAGSVAQERVQRLYARPVFQSGEEMWKRIATGAAEGSPLERILKENTRFQKELKTATDEVGAKIEKGFADIKNNVVILTGEP